MAGEASGGRGEGWVRGVVWVGGPVELTIKVRRWFGRQVRGRGKGGTGEGVGSLRLGLSFGTFFFFNFFVVLNLFD